MTQALRLPDRNKTYRLAQWATGRIGAVSLKAILSSPQFKLVGVYVHSAEKEGQDAGALCGMPATGVKATRDIEKIIAAKPDCVVANMEGPCGADVCRFLEAGINIVTSRVDYLDPETMDQDLRSQVEAACAKGGASIHSGGSSPGFSSEALPMVLASMSRRVEAIIIDEFANVPASCPDYQTVDQMGFGRPHDGKDLDPRFLEHAAHGFRQSINVLAKALNARLDNIDVRGETAPAKQRFLLPGGTPIEQSGVAAQRITVAGMRGGKPFLSFRINWYATLDIAADWELRENGWRVQIAGDTPMDVHITFPTKPGEARFKAAMAGLTAYQVLNSAPFVIEAAPGVRTTADLPTIAPDLR
jgi:hypothetical protein